MERERVVVAEILRARGNRGEVLARSQSDIPGRLEKLKTARVHLANGADERVELEAAWPHKGDWVLKFAGVDSIHAAQKFRGADLWVPASERGTLGEGEFFQSDLVGCHVQDRTGRVLGCITGWQEYGGPPLMEVEADGQTVLIPFSRAFCDVRLDEGMIAVDVPDGLLDL